MEDFKDVVPPAKKRSFGGFFIKFMLLLVVAGGILFWWNFYYTYSDGYRSGVLQKLSHKGNFAKTYEGELILSSVTSSVNVPLASEKFFFSIENDSLARVMMNFEGKRVRVHYQQKKGTLFWRGESEYIVDEAKPESAGP